MDGRRESLRECIERYASSAQREAQARVNDGENDEMEENRSMPVGDAIEGALPPPAPTRAVGARRLGLEGCACGASLQPTRPTHNSLRFILSRAVIYLIIGAEQGLTHHTCRDRCRVRSSVRRVCALHTFTPYARTFPRDLVPLSRRRKGRRGLECRCARSFLPPPSLLLRSCTRVTPPAAAPA